jgi:hypothetical protein
MAKRLFEEFLAQNNELSPEELTELGQRFMAESQKRKRPAESRIQQSIDRLRRDYDKIEFGDDWKSELTEKAVRQIEALQFQPIFQEVLTVPDINLRWELGLNISDVLVDFMFDAEEIADKLVNGSAGEWCPNTAEAIERFWHQMIAKNQKESLSLSLLNRIKDEEFTASLGDYGDLSFVPEALNAYSQFGMKKDEAIVIDD